MRNLSFPAWARKMRFSGAIEVLFIVGTDGGVEDIRIEKSSGHDLLDSNVVAAIRKSAPFPGSPEKARIALPVAFRLKCEAGQTIPRGEKMSISADREGLAVCRLFPSSPGGRKKMSIVEKLIEYGTPLSTNRTVSDVRIGLGYTLVELDGDSAGLAWTPDSRASSCTHLRHAGKLQGIEAKELIGWLDSDNFLERAVALAAFNAANSRVERRSLDAEAISLLQIRPGDRVVMVGYFGPLIPKLQEVGCTLSIVELDQGKPGVIPVGPGMAALGACDVAIITSTSIVNDTVDGLLAALADTRAAVMLGPSTPLCPEAFAGTRITQLSGAYVTNAESSKSIVSQGGGTMLLKKSLKFASLQT